MLEKRLIEMLKQGKTTDVYRLLLKHQTELDVDYQNDDGDTLLIHACNLRDASLVKHLVEYGANSLLMNKAKVTPLALARQSRNASIRLWVVSDIASRQGYIDYDEDVGDRIETNFILNKLITTLIYKSKRHNWADVPCLEIRRLIETLKPSFAKKDKNFFSNYITSQEQRSKTYFGSYLSSSSDSDDEQAFLKEDLKERKKKLAYARKLTQRAQIDNLTRKRSNAKQNLKKGDLKDFKYASSVFNLPKRTKIYHSNLDMNKVRRDLDRLNILLGRGKTIKEVLTEMGNDCTKFYVMQTRGITYATNNFNKPSRQQHRANRSEENKPQYSTSALRAAQINLFKNYNKAWQKIVNNETNIQEHAECLREILLLLREKSSYSYKGYTFSSLALLLQNAYTEDYDNFHQLIENDPFLRGIFLNSSNPFVSTGDTPYHGEKYAAGIKFYQGHKDNRLRPRWRKNGKAEYPYSGAVYLSIHPLTDFDEEGALNLVSLNWQGEVHIKNELNILPERESCFPAYLPKDRVFRKDIIKYPSFKGDYKNIYLIKYGLTQELYDKFKEGFRNSAPHSKKRKQLKLCLGEWLCSYHEVRHIDAGRKKAETLGGVLIYQDIRGRFSLTPPIDSPNRNHASNDQKKKSTVKQTQAYRKQVASNSAQDGIVYHNFKLKREHSHYNVGCSSQLMDYEVYSENVNPKHLLLLNALDKQYYRAFSHFLSQSAFKEYINLPMNSYDLDNATLLHIAVQNCDVEAVKILLNNLEVNVNATCDLSTNEQRDDQLYYENLTPLALAVVNNQEEIIKLFIQNPRVIDTRRYACVSNKDLLDDRIISYDNELLGFDWSRRTAVPIERLKGLSLVDITSSEPVKQLLNNWQAKSSSSQSTLICHSKQESHRVSLHATDKNNKDNYGRKKLLLNNGMFAASSKDVPNLTRETETSQKATQVMNFRGP